MTRWSGVTPFKARSKVARAIPLACASVQSSAAKLTNDCSCARDDRPWITRSNTRAMTYRLDMADYRQRSISHVAGRYQPCRCDRPHQACAPCGYHSNRFKMNTTISLVRDCSLRADFAFRAIEQPRDILPVHDPQQRGEQQKDGGDICKTKEPQAQWCKGAGTQCGKR